MREFSKRVLSALVIAPLAGVAVWYGDWLFDLLLVVAFVLMAEEWRAMTASLSGVRKIGSVTLGLVYILAAVFAAHVLRGMENGLDIIVWIVLVVVATDVGAYIFGRLIGGPKLAPVISPNKTWAGLAGGMACASAVSWLAMYPSGGINFAIVVGAAGLAVVAQFGDLLESGCKRLAHVKDSGRIIPGHGGILDRLDGYLAAVPALWLYISITGETIRLGVPAWPF